MKVNSYLLIVIWTFSFASTTGCHGFEWIEPHGWLFPVLPVRYVIQENHENHVQNHIDIFVSISNKDNGKQSSSRNLEFTGSKSIEELRKSELSWTFLNLLEFTWI